MPKIIVNGKSYSGIDEMPQEIRRAYEQAMGILADKDQNGMPDILEGVIGAENIDVQSAPITVSSTQFVVDGKTYSSVDELPHEARQKYEQALAEMNMGMGDATQSAVRDNFGGAQRAPVAMSMPPSFADVGSDEVAHYRGMLLIAGIVIIVLLVALVVLGTLVAPSLVK